MRKALLASLVLLASLPALAAQEGKAPFARSDEPIKIKSDRLNADNNKKNAVFTGNVVARQGDLTIYADKMVINYSEAEGDVSSVEIFGNVRIVQLDRRGQADHAIYNAKTATIVLDGNPKVFQDKDTITGNVITYYLDQEKSEVTSGADKRVEAIIHPKEKKRDSPPRKQ